MWTSVPLSGHDPTSGAPKDASGRARSSHGHPGVVEGGARSHTEVARLTGLARPTAHRLLKAMEAHGLVSYIGGQGYLLGPRLLGLAATAMRELPLRDLAQPVLERLARATGESAQLFVRDHHKRVCIAAAESEASSGRSSRSAPSCRSRRGRRARCSSRSVLRRSPRISSRPPTVHLRDTGG